MGCSVSHALVLSFLVLAPALVAQPAPRRPRGIYAVVNVEENIKKEQTANPSITPAELNAYFVNLYQDLLGNPAVSGLRSRCTGTRSTPILRPPPMLTTGAYVDDAFNQASAWNAQNPAQASEDHPARPAAGLSDAANGCWIRFPVATGCFSRPFRLLRARAERRPLPVSWKGAASGSFRCRGTRCIRAPGGPS